MCGTLKHNHSTYRQGDKVGVFNPEKQRVGFAQWDGFAHQEKFEWWSEASNAVPVQILAEAIIEGKTTFRVPTGRIQALGLKKNVLVHGKLVGHANQVKMLTRDPMNTFEKAIHSRWPVVHVNNRIYQWSEKDLITEQMSLL